MTVVIRNFIGSTLLCLMTLVTLQGQVDQQDWMNLEIVAIEISDTITAGCEIPINITIENPSDELVNTTDYSIRYNITETAPDFPSSSLIELTIHVDGMVLAAGETTTIQQSLPVREPLFEFPEEDEPIKKNVVIVWGGGGVFAGDDNGDHIMKEVDVTNIELVDASVTPVDSLDLTGPIDPDDFDLLDGAEMEECFPFGEFVYSEIDVVSEEYFIRCETDAGDFVFWSLDGNFIKCDTSPELLGVLEDLPAGLWDELDEIAFGEEFIGETALIQFQNQLYYSVEDNFDGAELLFSLSYEFVGIDGVLFQSEINADLFPFVFGEGVEVVNTETLDNGHIVVELSNGYFLTVDEAGNWLFLDAPGSGDAEGGQVASGDVPEEFVQLVEDSFPGQEIEFTYLNTLACSIMFEAVVDGNTVYTYDVGSGESSQIIVGIGNESNVNIEIYPNPSEGPMFIGGDLSGLEELKVYDLQGRVVYTTTNVRAKVALEHLNSGSYLIQLIGNNESKVIPWVKL